MQIYIRNRALSQTDGKFSLHKRHMVDDNQGRNGESSILYPKSFFLYKTKFYFSLIYVHMCIKLFLGDLNPGFCSSTLHKHLYLRSDHRNKSEWCTPNHYTSYQSILNFCVCTLVCTLWMLLILRS